ncbi:MAG TPA: ATP phosphoribosyltransferase regulatory subunit [Hyphomicrobiaceae bacterium]|jgi:ATP phosphoribosyltransferase regulatory subunit
MSATSTSADIEALDALAQRLMGAFARAGYERVEPPIIQPADLFLDVVGESLRARTYVFTDPDGAELCLRPDLTVPTCRLHLERHAAAGTQARYCYSGSAFRYQSAGAGRAHPREFHQAGIESFAAPDREQDDAAVLALIVAALREAGLGPVRLRLGDLGLFAALINALDMPERWRWRLRHQFWRPDAFRAELARLSSNAARRRRGAPDDRMDDLIDRLDPDNPAAAEALVAEHLDRLGIEPVGTRSVAEISERLLAEAADRREQPLRAETAALIEAYVAVKAPVRAVADRLGTLARGRGIDLSAGLDAFARRLDRIEATGVSTADAEFSAEFGRNLEYYTGFVFEVIAPALGPRSPVAGGGRYDSLLAQVGAPANVPAVGASIHTERLLSALQEAGPGGAP